MSWLPTTMRVGTLIVASLRQRFVGSEDRLDLGGEGSVERPNPSGPSQPTTGTSRRNERGPITHRAAWPAIAPMPWRWASHAHDCKQLLAPRLVADDVHTSVSERTRSGQGP